MGALDGIRVIDLGLLVQGPQAALMLAEMGADVIKVEYPIMGDHSRGVIVSMPEADFRSAYYTGVNRGKRAMTLDLHKPEAVEVFKALIATADVLVSNFKTGTLDEWGLDYETLSEINPGLVHATGTSFGSLGPDAHAESADLGAQARGGLISTTGADGGPVTPVGVTVADHIASQNMVAGILAALVARGRTGRGQKVEVSLLGGQIYAQAAEYTYRLMTGKNPGRSNQGHPLLMFIYGVFPTADGAIGVIGVPPAAKTAFFDALGRPDLGADERYNQFFLAEDDKRELFAILSTEFRRRTTDEWLSILLPLGQRVAPVNDYGRAIDDPMVIANGYIVDADDGNGGTVRVVGNPIRMSDTPTVVSGLTPELGQDTEMILMELGYEWDRIEALRAAGAI